MNEWLVADDEKSEACGVPDLSIYVYRSIASEPQMYVKSFVA